MSQETKPWYKDTIIDSLLVILVLVSVQLFGIEITEAEVAEVLILGGSFAAAVAGLISKFRERFLS